MKMLYMLFMVVCLAIAVAAVATNPKSKDWLAYLTNAANQEKTATEILYDEVIVNLRSSANPFAGTDINIAYVNGTIEVGSSNKDIKTAISVTSVFSAAAAKTFPYRQVKFDVTETQTGMYYHISI